MALLTMGRVLRVRWRWLLLAIICGGVLVLRLLDEHRLKKPPQDKRSGSTHEKNPKWGNFVRMKPDHSLLETEKDPIVAPSSSEGAMDADRNNNYDSNILYFETYGRLGNNLFQYASAYGIAKTTKRIAVIAPSNPVAELFQRSPLSLVSRRLDASSLEIMSENASGIYSPHLVTNLPHIPLSLCCYFQSWKYFQKYSRDIRELFTFRSYTKKEANDAIKLLTQKYMREVNDIADNFKPLPTNQSREFFQHLKTRHKNITHIGVHLRMSDLLEADHIERGYTAAPLSYIRKAMDYFRRKYPVCLFLVCTDSPEYVQENLIGYDIQHVPYMDAEAHLATLAKCNHTIMSTGTFSWWAAWLAGGDTVYYSNWPGGGSELAERYKKEDYFLPNWIPMDG